MRKISEVYEWEHDIKVKRSQLETLFPKDEGEVVYFEDPLAGMEHYFFRIGEIHEDIWTNEICWRFTNLDQYLTKYLAKIDADDITDLNKEQFRIVSSIARIVGVKFFLNTMYILVIDGWDQEVIDRVSELWQGKMFPTVEEEQSIATWYSFEISDNWTEEYSN